MIDTHSHLGDPVFADDLESVLTRARDSGVEQVLAVSEKPADIEHNLRLAREHPMLRPCGGLHPEFPDDDEAKRCESLIRAHRDELLAIGEVGLDHWKVQEEERRDLQRAIFVRFIQLSLELDLPLNVHSRSAARPTVELLLGEGAQRVQLHAFDGRASKALPAVEAGFYFSVPPSIVRSRQKQKLVRQLPLDCLLLESDSPVLGPRADERNEPANLAIGLQVICELKSVSREEALETIDENARRLYRL